MDNEAMEAVIAYGYAHQAHKPLPELSYETLMKGIEEHKQYVDQYLTDVIYRLYYDWSKKKNKEESDKVVIPYVQIANDCHAFLLASIRAYVNKIIPDEHLGEFARTMCSHDGVICTYLSSLKGHIDLVATLVQTKFWIESRSKFCLNDLPWWLNDEIISHAKKLKLITD